MSKNRIEWKRIYAEGAIIVVSILLAFWIDAWWNDTQTREEEKAVLSALLTEFELIRGNVDDILMFQAAILDSVQELLKLSVNENPTISNSELDRLLVDQRWGSSPDRFSAPELNSVIARGDLRLISNRELRGELRAWPAKFTWISKALAEDFQFSITVVDPYFRNNLSLLQLHETMAHRPGDPTFVPETPAVKAKEKVSHIAVLTDMTFQNIMAQRYDLLNEIINLAREPELPQQLDQTIESLRMEIEE